MIHVPLHPHVRPLSLTRIAPFGTVPFSLRRLDQGAWASGDYVACEVAEVPGPWRSAELPSGRMVELARGDVLIGALGRRHATLEATGTYEAVGADGRMHLLTGAGLVGAETSRAVALGPLIALGYRGHLFVDGARATMGRYVPDADPRPFSTPTVLLIGTSMSAGKTTAGRHAVRLLKARGQRVVGAKLTGAGRYRDILALRDDGADAVLDFVDAGLPSTVVPEEEYRPALGWMLARLAAAEADVAVVEIGASPLEPYNGAVAVEGVRAHVACTLLAASDPYAALGVMDAFGATPDVICGRATNTTAGVELAERLCGVRALDLTAPEGDDALAGVLCDALGLPRLSKPSARGLTG
ncbi:MAG: hypothetical protein R3181_09850 [Rubricoccaceae bacterium]|nr:hypothetical protein [Rubricoccaceae bacterium]